MDSAWCSAGCSSFLDSVQSPVHTVYKAYYHTLLDSQSGPFPSGLAALSHVGFKLYCLFSVFCTKMQRNILWLQLDTIKVLRNNILPVCIWILMHGLAMKKCQVIIPQLLTEVETPELKSAVLLCAATVLEKST